VTLVGQLQDEVATLRNQLEEFQLQSTQWNSGSTSVNGSSPRRDVPAILDLNALAMPSNDEEEVPNDNTTTK
jgi:hypothetical protein